MGFSKAGMTRKTRPALSAMMMQWKPKFEQALPYKAFLEKHADPRMDQPRWQQAYQQIRLTDSQTGLLGGFTRSMNLLCLVGAWCGDCIEQGAILQRIAEAATGHIDLRFLDRDASPNVQDELRICGGNRVPVAVFLSEDFHECARFGDRTLSTYRQNGRETGRRLLSHRPAA